MSRSLILSALRAAEKVAPFKPGKELADYLKSNNLGKDHGRKLCLDRHDRRTIRELLQREFNVPLDATADSWEGLSRSEALSFGGNEKMTTKKVRKETIAIKAMPGRPLRLTDRDVSLPDGAALIMAGEDVALSDRHDCVVLVENWEVFEAIHKLTFDIPEHLRDALVLYRGDLGVFSTGAASAWLKSLSLPVYVFSDPDPAGLMIAATTPGFAGLMFPPLPLLRQKLCEGRGDRERYLAQIANIGSFLAACDNEEIVAYRDAIEEAGRALPQEEFIRET